MLAKLEVGAFRKLCEHLRERSDVVQNIDLMTIGGFCRNCLAKVCEIVCFVSLFLLLLVQLCQLLLQQQLASLQRELLSFLQKLV